MTAINLPEPSARPDRVPMPALSPTRRRLLETAEALFYSEGFHAVGLDRILKTVGISKPGFYRHFSSKEDLVVEVLRWHDRWWRDHCRAIIEQEAGRDAMRQLRTFIGLILDALKDDNFRGCFFVNAASEFPNRSDPVHLAAVQAKENIEAMVRDMALKAGADDPLSFAQEIVLLLEGAFATRRLRSADEMIPVVRRMVEGLFSRHVFARRRAREPMMV